MLRQHSAFVLNEMIGDSPPVGVPQTEWDVPFTIAFLNAMARIGETRHMNYIRELAEAKCFHEQEEALEVREVARRTRDTLDAMRHLLPQRATLLRASSHDATVGAETLLRIPTSDSAVRTDNLLKPSSSDKEEEAGLGEKRQPSGWATLERTETLQVASDTEPDRITLQKRSS